MYWCTVGPQYSFFEDQPTSPYCWWKNSCNTWSYETNWFEISSIKGISKNMAIQGPKRLRIRFQPVATRSCALWSLTGTLTSKLDVVPLGFILVGCFNPIENITVCAYVLMIITPTRCKNRTCLKPGPRANKNSSLSNLQRWSFWSGKHWPGHEPHDAPEYKKNVSPKPTLVVHLHILFLNMSTCQWKITFFYRSYIFKWLSFHYHVRFPGCI